jgi:type I restriction enzyme S subunit
MTQEIVKRLEEIQNGEIPEGYKRTKAGIIPEKWEIKKLSDILKKQTQKNTNNEIQNILTNSAKQGIVCQTEYFDKQIANDENTSGYYVVKPGYFVYNPRISVSAPCGPFNRYNGDEDGIMSPLYSVYCFYDKSITCADFLTYYFSSSKWHAYMNSIANYGARSDRMNVTKEDMDNMPIPYPPLPEQQKIVEILSAQDRVIECYEKKIDQLKRMKKYYLQNMFPKRGETIPKIRFKGFTDPWEQRKLGEICQVTMGQSPDGSTYSEIPSDYILVQGNADLKDSWVFPRIWTTQKTKTAEAGDLIMSVRAPAGAMGKTSYNVVLGRGVAGIKGNEFIYQSLVKMDSDGYWKKLAAGSTFESINSDVVNGAELVVPQDIAEQNKIGEYFSSIDHLITLHQRKLEAEKQKKKSLMQLLLTGIVRT